MVKDISLIQNTYARQLRRKGVKFPPVLKELPTNGAGIAGKRKRETEKDVCVKRRSESIPRLKQTFVSFDFEPAELNCHRFVSTRLQSLLDPCNPNIQLEFGKDLLIIHHSSVPVRDICLEIFASEPSCEKPSKDGDVLQTTVAVCYVDGNLEKSKLSQELLAHLSKSIEKGQLFFVSAQNWSRSIENVLGKCKIKFSPNQIITRTSKMSMVYEKMYEALEGNVQYVKKALDALPQESEMLPSRRKFSYIEKKLKDRMKPRCLSENCKRELKSALDFGVIAYRTDRENLTVYINQPRTRSLDAKLRNLEENCSPLNLRCCRVQTPFYKPHSLRAGCRVDNGGRNVSGTIGLFAKKIGGNEETDIGITSAHVIWEGCSARVHLEGSNQEIGHCTWPPQPAGDYLDARMLDMAVIEIKSDIAEKISTSQNISLYTGQRDELTFQQVYKSGWTTETTFGDIDNPQFNMLGKNVMLITRANGQNFSEPGDSGALVLTKRGTRLLALGLIFGKDLRFFESDENFPENSSIAVYLDNAISRFEEGGNENIKIDRY